MCLLTIVSGTPPKSTYTEFLTLPTSAGSDLEQEFDFLGKAFVPFKKPFDLLQKAFVSREKPFAFLKKPFEKLEQAFDFLEMPIEPPSHWRVRLPAVLATGSLWPTGACRISGLQPFGGIS